MLLHEGLQTSNQAGGVIGVSEVHGALSMRK